MTPLGAIGQLGIVVPDIADATGRYGELFGIDQWHRYTYSADLVPSLEFHGERAEFTVRIALGGSGPQIELIQPDGGRSAYSGHLGLHHVGVFVDSLDRAIHTMTTRGYRVLQLGRDYGLDGDGGFAYFDTAADYHVIVEAIEIPKRRNPNLTGWLRPKGTP